MKDYTVSVQVEEKIYQDFQEVLRRDGIKVAGRYSSIKPIIRELFERTLSDFVKNAGGI